jgi:hypothetical protein
VRAAVIEPAPARTHERGQPPRTYPDPPPVATILRPQSFLLAGGGTDACPLAEIRRSFFDR